MNRCLDLVRELLQTCPQDAYLDFCLIADALERGYSRDEILGMPAVIRWPNTAAWLAERMI